MKFDRVAAEKELSSLLAKMDVTVNDSEYPQLAKMDKRGNKANWRDYFADLKKQREAEGEQSC